MHFGVCHLSHKFSMEFLYFAYVSVLVIWEVYKNQRIKMRLISDPFRNICKKVE